jgi:proline iminopeptidase
MHHALSFLMRVFPIFLVVTIVAEPCQAFVSRGVTQTHHRLRFVPPHTRSHLRAATTNEGEVTVCRGQTECKLAYRIVRPMSLSSRMAAPVVVLHGGPSVPSDYLYPLEQHVPYRSIVFYDQIGCGKSSEPTDPVLYSIDAAVDDLEALLRKIGLKRFHLYGQSFGGILAFEFIKRLSERLSDASSSSVECLSVTLSSTPTCVQLVEQEADRLVAALDTDTDDETPSISVAERFRLQHQCRTPEMPRALADAYAHAGTVWRGTRAIADYQAAPSPPSETVKARRMPSCMVLRGEHDFVTEPCVEGWKKCFNHKFVRYKTLEGCSHHGLLENGPLYGDVVDSFFGEYD